MVASQDKRPGAVRNATGCQITQLLARKTCWLPRTEHLLFTRKRLTHREDQRLHPSYENLVADQNCCTTEYLRVFPSRLLSPPPSRHLALLLVAQPREKPHKTSMTVTPSLSTSLSHHRLPSCPPPFPVSLAKIRFSSFENQMFIVCVVCLRLVCCFCVRCVLFRLWCVLFAFAFDVFFVRLVCFVLRLAC